MARGVLREKRLHTNMKGMAVYNSEEGISGRMHSKYKGHEGRGEGRQPAREAQEPDDMGLWALRETRWPLETSVPHGISLLPRFLPFCFTDLISSTLALPLSVSNLLLKPFI